MNPDELLKLMKHIIVWIPSNNPIRSEIQNIINSIIQNRKQQ